MNSSQSSTADSEYFSTVPRYRKFVTAPTYKFFNVHREFPLVFIIYSRNSKCFNIKPESGGKHCFENSTNIYILKSGNYLPEEPS
jgi:hypothetical protein